MPSHARRRNALIVLVIVIIAVLLLLANCLWRRPVAPVAPGGAGPTPITSGGPASQEPAAEPDEILTPATVAAPAEVAAGAAFTVMWTGPDNRGDYVTIVGADAPAEASGDYADAATGTAGESGKTAQLTAPIEPGAYEVRYVAGRSKTVLGRAPVEVMAAAATLEAAAEVVLGSTFAVTWTGPDNEGDYLTVVAKDAPDEHYGNYVDAKNGSPLTLTAPPTAGEAEVRYVAAQGRKVLARRPITVVAAEVTLSAPGEAVAGTTIEVAWTGPNNEGDYITVVASGIPDGQYGHYTNTSGGSPLRLLMPIQAGAAELRYMTGQGRQVLGRRAITVAAAKVTLSAPDRCAAGAPVSITWTGPNNPGDYITVVPKGTPDGRYAAYTNTSAGSPLSVTAPKEAGEAEVRYCAGQGNAVLARAAITIVP